MSEVTTDQFVRALAQAHDITQRFEAAFGRHPTDVEYKIAFTLVPKSPNGHKAAPAQPDQPDTPLPTECPQCSGPLWDNRADKADGKVSKKYPDFKCKDKDCDWVTWVDRKKGKDERATSRPAPEPMPTSSASTGLPF